MVSSVLTTVKNETAMPVLTTEKMETNGTTRTTRGHAISTEGKPGGIYNFMR